MNHDAFLDSKSLRNAAKYQEEFKTLHPSGYTVSKFITVVVRSNIFYHFSMKLFIYINKYK
jgi:hypothetical protein